jgi:hypothetical protein
VAQRDCFDVVTMFEVFEHVARLSCFLTQASALTGGIPTRGGEGLGRAEEVRRPAGEAKFVLGQVNIQRRSGMGDRGSINTGGLR